MKRVFLIVLDSLGIGALPDAERYGDAGANTLKSVAASRYFAAPNLLSLGLFDIEGVGGGTAAPLAARARLAEMSDGKDTIIGHWEIAGVVSQTPLNTYPDGFPDEIVSPLERETGKKFLCNRPYSGTEVIKDYGRAHIETGSPILYTSADSVMQIAAHEKIVPLKELYEICEKARELTRTVGRIIARPFDGDYPDFYRTAGRRDYALDPPSITMLDVLKQNGFDVIAVGKIAEVFNGRGVTESVKTQNNAEGIRALKENLAKNFCGLCFANLVDFDMMYGHRRDADGYAKTLSDFDGELIDILDALREDDLLVITADHGCDPSEQGTDHTREYVPMLAYGKKVLPVDLKTRSSFADIAATVLDYFGLKADIAGESFWEEIANENR